VETALYEVKPEVIKQIAAANEVKVQINGQPGSSTASSSRSTFQKFRHFVLTHMGGF
jgi:hypothetical protein